MLARVKRIGTVGVVVVLRRLHYLLMCTAILGLFSPKSAHAQKAVCPGAVRCPVPGFPIGGGQCTIDTFADKKGGGWKYMCTNVPGGDFVWTYDEAGPKGVKEIGRCVFKGGQNNHGHICDPNNPRQILQYWHYVIDGNDKNHAVIHVFDKTLNAGLEVEVRFNKTTEEWEEVERRSYSSLDIPPETGTIPRDKQPAVDSVALRLVSSSGQNPNEANIRWSSFVGATPARPNPSLTLGDSVYLDGLSITDIVDLDPRFSASTSPPGIELTATTAIVVNTGDLLATVRRPETRVVFYSIRDVGAHAFYQNVLGGAPLDASWSTRVDLGDMVGYAAAAGTLNLLVPIPTVSEWGLVILALLLLAGAKIYFGRRRATESA